MTISNQSDNAGPALDVRQRRVQLVRPGLWGVTFDVMNRGAETATLLVAWLPHGNFHAQERSLAGTPPLAPGDSTGLSFDVSFGEVEGAKVENAFVILRVGWRGEEWRVLSRFTVAAGVGGEPQASPENVMAHRVGFSG